MLSYKDLLIRLIVEIITIWEPLIIKKKSKTNETKNSTAAEREKKFG